ncbi:MAG: outer membrane protein assembly factor BamD [Candidatus Adiutrix sp.]|jgi:outer membrane protein assembly factor BamD|nr:outer membrane protein assembly factor BamD [Candidatus Adiutrix sp.]
MRIVNTLGAVVLVMALGSMSGCGQISLGTTVNKWLGLQSDTELDLGSDAPSSLAGQAQARMEADDYKGAATLWQQLKDQYPYSRFAVLAELKLGDALYLQEKYVEALAAYEDFERLHPDNEAVPYSIYQQGMCHYMRMQGIDRDQTPTIQTIQTLARLVEMYPSSQYAAMGQARIAEAQNNLAGHEFYVGEFYYKRQDYEAAINRFMGLLQYYPDSGYHQRALNYIADYKQLVADGKVTPGENQRDDMFDSPFLQDFDPSGTGSGNGPMI